jgi:hypothetical protein
MSATTLELRNLRGGEKAGISIKNDPSMDDDEYLMHVTAAFRALYRHQLTKLGLGPPSLQHTDTDNIKRLKMNAICCFADEMTRHLLELKREEDDE